MKRATQGGYGGKPPCVAIIGVSTGARNAGKGAPTGDQSTDMNATRKQPLLRKRHLRFTGWLIPASRQILPALHEGARVGRLAPAVGHHDREIREEDGA